MDFDQDKAKEFAMEDMSRKRNEFCVKRLIELGLSLTLMEQGQIYRRSWDSTDVDYFEYLYGQLFIFGELVTYPIQPLDDGQNKISMQQQLFDTPQTHAQIILAVKQSEGEKSVSLGGYGKIPTPSTGQMTNEEKMTAHVDRERKVMLKKLGFRQDLFERGMVESNKEDARPFYYEHRRAGSNQFIFSEILMITDVGGKPGFVHILYPKRLRDDQYQKAMRGERF